MLRGPLYEDGYRPQLSGHETFPLRYGWLKKAHDAVRKSEDQADNGEVFSGLTRSPDLESERTWSRPCGIGRRPLAWSWWTRAQTMPSPCLLDVGSSTTMDSTHTWKTRRHRG